jgi:hypothetical protein
MNEMMVCRLKALVRATWPERFVARPALTVVDAGRGTAQQPMKRPQRDILLARRQTHQNRRAGIG